MCVIGYVARNRCVWLAVVVRYVSGVRFEVWQDGRQLGVGLATDRMVTGPRGTCGCIGLHGDLHAYCLGILGRRHLRPSTNLN